MIRHPRVYLQQLDEAEIGAVIDAALLVLEERGMEIQSDYLCRLLDDVGCGVEMSKQNVRFPAGIIKKYLARAPSKWIFHARNPEKNIEIGGTNLHIAPGYGVAFVADREGKRRNASLEDFKRFTSLAAQNDVVDVTGGVLVEPMDVPVHLRHLEMTRILLTHSDKPFMGSVLGKQNAADSIEMARIVLGDISARPSVLALININSPLRLDKVMAEAMVEYVGANQPVLLSPGIMMGITAPVTVSGALVQATAELMGCAAITQIMNPGTPIIIGSACLAADLKTAGIGFGRPEEALGTLAGAQIARRLKLPFRSTVAVTGSRRPDCRSGYERMMMAMASWSAGVHFGLHAFGVLDSINAMSYEQFIIDVEIWSYIKRIAMPISTDGESLAVDVINSSCGDYLSEDHTLEHMREELFPPALVSGSSYETWLSSGGEDVVGLAAEKADRISDMAGDTGISAHVEDELDHFIVRRSRVA